MAWDTTGATLELERLETLLERDDEEDVRLGAADAEDLVLLLWAADGDEIKLEGDLLLEGLEDGEAARIKIPTLRLSLAPLTTRYRIDLR